MSTVAHHKSKKKKSKHKRSHVDVPEDFEDRDVLATNEKPEAEPEDSEDVQRDVFKPSDNVSESDKKTDSTELDMDSRSTKKSKKRKVHAEQHSELKKKKKKVECDVCGEDHITEHCPIKCFAENESLSKARSTLPNNLKVTQKADGSVGVLANETIAPKTKFGPLEARKSTQDKSDDHFLLKLLDEDGSVFTFDTSDENECNWLCLVQPAQNELEQNCIAYQLGVSFFFSTTKEITKGDEMKVRYAPQYAKKLNKSAIPDDKVPKEKNATGITRIVDSQEDHNVQKSDAEDVFESPKKASKKKNKSKKGRSDLEKSKDVTETNEESDQTMTVDEKLASIEWVLEVFREIQDLLTEERVPYFVSSWKSWPAHKQVLFLEHAGKFKIEIHIQDLVRFADRKAVQKEPKAVQKNPGLKLVKVKSKQKKQLKPRRITGYNIFTSEVVAKMKDVPPLERWGKVSEVWRKLSDDVKNQYRTDARERNLKFKDLSESNKSKAGMHSDIESENSKPYKPAVMYYIEERKEIFSKENPGLSEEEIVKVLRKKYSKLVTSKKEKYEKMSLQKQTKVTDYLTPAKSMKKKEDSSDKSDGRNEDSNVSKELFKESKKPIHSSTPKIQSNTILETSDSSSDSESEEEINFKDSNTLNEKKAQHHSSSGPDSDSESETEAVNVKQTAQHASSSSSSSSDSESESDAENHNALLSPPPRTMSVKKPASGTKQTVQERKNSDSSSDSSDDEDESSNRPILTQSARKQSPSKTKKLTTTTPHSLQKFHQNKNVSSASESSSSSSDSSSEEETLPLTQPMRTPANKSTPGPKTKITLRKQKEQEETLPLTQPLKTPAKAKKSTGPKTKTTPRKRKESSSSSESSDSDSD